MSRQNKKDNSGADMDASSGESSGIQMRKRGRTTTHEKILNSPLTKQTKSAEAKLKSKNVGTKKSAKRKIDFNESQKQTQVIQKNNNRQTLLCSIVEPKSNIF